MVRKGDHQLSEVFTKEVGLRDHPENLNGSHSTIKVTGEGF